MAKIGEKIRQAGSDFARSGPEILPGWLLNVGITSWMIIGAAGVLFLIAWFIAFSASVTVPLILAMVIGMIAYPLVEKMHKRGIPTTAGAGIVLVMLIGIVGAAIWITVVGIVAQWPSIQQQLQAGIDAARQALVAAGFDPQAIKDGLSQADPSQAASASGGMLSSLGSAIASGLSGTFALLFGVFIAVTLLFYVLTDFPTIARWIGSHMGGLPTDVGEGIVDDAVRAMRGYFRGTTLTGVAVATCIGVAMVIMGIPLAFSVALVTFMTCYIPYFGAIISGVFAFFVALGSGGMTDALILLVIVLITQNVLQTVINARVMGDSLDLHPLVVLVVTMLGGIFGGLLGAALGAPAAALVLSAQKRLAAIDWDAVVPDVDDDIDEVA